MQRSGPLNDNAGEHYFTRQPVARSRPQEIRARVRGIGLVFMTDRGVFSYGRVDRGSRLLIETVEAGD
ncbi:MAG: methyltransferase, partial [Armatimonadetes bacterium]|nr:methyltransferase [Armatimonadota bacterium]